MATFLSLLRKHPRSMVEETFKRRQLADIARKEEFNAALKVQSWYKKIRTECYLKHLSSCALKIQKTWRGFLGRRFSRIRIRQVAMIMGLNYYNEMAVVIQRHWRGFYVRKYVHNFYARRKYFSALAAKSDFFISKLEALKDHLELEEHLLARKKLEKRLEYHARNHHHLISTQEIPGIYNSPFLEFPHEMELRLKAVFHFDYVTGKSKKLAQKLEFKPHTVYSYKPHPPKYTSSLAKKELQGPFKPRKLVLRQRYKPFNPSMRCCIENDSLYEARKQLKRDEEAKVIHSQPFRHFYQYRTPYVGLEHTKSAYDVSNKLVLREENPTKHVSRTKMRNVLTPIPLFDRIGQAYTKGAVLL